MWYQMFQADYCLKQFILVIFSRVLMGPEIFIQIIWNIYFNSIILKTIANFDGLRFYPKSTGGAPAPPGMTRVYNICPYAPRCVHPCFIYVISFYRLQAELLPTAMLDEREDDIRRPSSTGHIQGPPKNLPTRSIYPISSIAHPNETLLYNSVELLDEKWNIRPTIVREVSILRLQTGIPDHREIN